MESEGFSMKAHSFVALFGVALASSVAAAAPDAPAAGQQGAAKYRKQEREVEGVPQTQLTKPTAPPKQEKKTGPTITLEDFTGQRTEKIQKITDQQIGQMQRLLRVTDDDDAGKPDFHF